MSTAINEMIKAQIANAGTKYVSVKTILRSGEVVTMVFNPRELARRLAAKQAVSISGAKGAATRAERYPNLVPVFDRGPRKIAKYGQAGESSFDLDNVLSVKANKVRINYRQPREQRFEAVNI